IEGVIFIERSTNVTVSNNSVQANLSYAIWFRNSNNTVITNNRVNGGGVNGYSNWDQGIVLDSSLNFQIIGNNVTLEAVGIQLCPGQLSVDEALRCGSSHSGSVWRRRWRWTPTPPSMIVITSGENSSATK